MREATLTLDEKIREARSTLDETVKALHDCKVAQGSVQDACKRLVTLSSKEKEIVPDRKVTGKLHAMKPEPYADVQVDALCK